MLGISDKEGKGVLAVRKRLARNMSSYLNTSFQDDARAMFELLASLEALARTMLHNCESPVDGRFMDAVCVLHTVVSRLDEETLQKHMAEIENSLAETAQERRRAIESLLHLIHLMQSA